MSSSTTPFHSTNQSKMIINSSVGKDLLPSSYTNNDFDGLFENEDRSSLINTKNNDRSGSANKKNPIAASSCSSYGSIRSHWDQQYDFQLNQAKLGGSFRQDGEDLFVMQKKQEDRIHQKTNSLLIQKHLERARLCLERANATEYLKANAVLQCFNQLKNSFSIQMPPDTRSTEKSVSCEPLQDLHRFLQTSQDPSKPQRAVSEECDVITTPLMSHLFDVQKKDEDKEEQDSCQHKKRSFENTKNPCNVSSFFGIPEERSKKKRCCKHAPSSPPPSSMDVSSQSHVAPKISTHRYVKTIASKLPRNQLEKNTNSHISSPLETYIKVLKSRSYDTSYFQSSSRYHSQPSNLQKASFGNAILNTVRSRDCKRLKELISCGLSPNPCNQFGDSVLNTICKRGYEDLFHTLMDCGASVVTCDDFGRTPLHFVCWSSSFCFSVAETILSIDAHMLRATDKVGKTPLDYVSTENWESWKQFLEEKKETFWPEQDKNATDHECMEHHRSVNSVPNPENHLSAEIAKLISSGSLKVADLANYQKHC
eukprot:CAMPEP_0203672634 /NCGR_PEP_ID=MMETSP0090-20130426/8627_1 /ASSEMBLY_ACC=CAM_ASM_001088 /TAXON_ID=426623 /ORGANISM="Chaetoceros affinis, Strain CCMP159" /LENGTH=537 /DNA_ID=CAMNT_0050537979 /DNA_START=79 /DNA_END=1692 /DNA_ORIENTATION=-